ncbi:hypothetical protein Tco_1177633 [Tanacetum coccineum]
MLVTYWFFETSRRFTWSPAKDASDFNYITDVKEPLVKEPRWFQPIYHIFDDDQLFVHGYSTDYNSYLDAKGDVNIFFKNRLNVLLEPSTPTLSNLNLIQDTIL